MLAAVAIVTIAGSSWGQPPSPAQDAPASKSKDPVTRVHGPKQVLEAQLEARRALLRIDVERAEQARRWAAYYEKLAQDGKVLEDRVLAARDDLMMMDAHLAAERADLKVLEIRAGVPQPLPATAAGASRVDPAGEELAVLGTMLDAKKALLRAAESRAERAKRMETHQEKLFRGGMATEDQVIAAKDDSLLTQAAVEWAKAGLKLTEVRVEAARRQAVGGEPAMDAVARRLLDLEDRLTVSEMKADVLQHEVGRLRRELPHETRGAR